MERFPRTLLDMQRLFPDDAACIQYLVERRWPNGFRCPHCDHDAAWWLESYRRWECRRCHRHTSITAGTLLHRTRLPLHTWFWAAYLMTTHSNGVSALQLTKQLGVAYSTAWLLETKIRRAMVDPDRSRLSGVVEVDQTEIPYREADPPLGVGGRTGMITVIGAVEVVERATGSAPPVRNDGRILVDSRAGRVRLQVIPSNEAVHVEAFLMANIEPGSLLLTDAHRSYNRAWELGYRHRRFTVGATAASIYLPWVHRVFALVKRWGLGVYHGLRRQHVQTYLDEFVFRFNRRAMRRQTFESIFALAVRSSPTTYSAITGAPPRDWRAEEARRRPDISTTSTGAAGSTPPSSSNEPPF